MVLNVVNRNPNLEREVVVQIGTLSGSAEEGLWPLSGYKGK